MRGIKFSLASALILAVTSADMFDFMHNFGNQQRQQQQQRQPSAYDLENSALNTPCQSYLCPGTSICVDGPNDCPCPFPSSQLRCVLPDGQFICISKPSGEVSEKYNDPEKNWQIDAKDDSVRDCGWVLRASRDQI